MYFDSHAHLDDARFQPDFDDILARMRENGVTGMMNIGCDLPSSERSVALAERYGWSVYDAMIVAAALRAGCTRLWSEDLQDGQLVEDRLRIANPFA